MRCFRVWAGPPDNARSAVRRAPIDEQLEQPLERRFRPTPMALAVLLLFLGVAGALLWQGRVLVQRARRLGGAP